MRRPRRRGFTLVEMVVAMGILVVGVSSVLGLLTFGAALQRTAEARNDVSWAAGAIVEELREELFRQEADGSVAPPPSAPFERPVRGHPSLSARIELRENPKLAGEYLATVSIGWRERGRRRDEVFRTILQREAPFPRRVERELARASGR